MCCILTAVAVLKIWTTLFHLQARSEETEAENESSTNQRETDEGPPTHKHRPLTATFQSAAIPEGIWVLHTYVQIDYL